MNDNYSIPVYGVIRGVLPVYRPYITDYRYSTVIHYGSASSGKSYFIAQKLLLKAMVDGGRRILVIRKVGTSLRDSVWGMFKYLVSKLPQDAYTINKSEYTITLINGSEFLFKGLDDPEKIKSIVDISDIFIEEATELSAEDYDQLTLRLRGKKKYKQMYLSFNPISTSNWIYRRFFTPEARARLHDTQIIRTTYKDNPTLDKAQIERIEDLIHTNSNYYKVYAEGKFATLDKLVFPKYLSRYITEEEILSFKKRAGRSIYKWAGLDWGYTNDPCRLVYGWYEPLKPISNLYIEGEVTLLGATNDKVAEMLKSYVPNDIVVADSAEKKSIQEVKNFGFKGIRASDKGAGSILLGIDRINRCNVIIDSSCVETIKEFDSYTWKKDKKSGEYINEPIDKYNHSIDAIRYGIQPVINKKAYSEAELLQAARYLYGG